MLFEFQFTFRFPSFSDFVGQELSCWSFNVRFNDLCLAFLRKCCSRLGKLTRIFFEDLLGLRNYMAKCKYW